MGRRKNWGLPNHWRRLHHGIHRASPAG